MSVPNQGDPEQPEVPGATSTDAAEPAKFEVKVDHAIVGALGAGPNSRTEGNVHINAQQVVIGSVSGTAQLPQHVPPNLTFTSLGRGSILTGRDSSYVVGDPIDKGGVGTVYQAKARPGGTKVAIKVLHGGRFAITDAALARFRKEIEIALLLDHPNLIKALDAGEYQGRPFLVLEFMPGGTVAHRIAKKTYDDSTAFRWCRNLIVGLLHLHGRGLVHRDIKPNNLLLTGDDLAKIADFGIVRDTSSNAGLTLTGDQMGSILYISRHQLEHPNEAGPDDDVYAACCCIYELLSRKRIRPFMPSLYDAVAGKVSRDINDLVMSCLGDTPTKNSLETLLKCFEPDETGKVPVPDETAISEDREPTVLLVNDEPGTMKAFVDYCRARGLRLSYAFSVADAMDAIVATRPTVIVSDLSHFYWGKLQTERAAFEILERAHKGGINVKVIITCGNLTPERREEAARLGAIGICNDLRDIDRFLESVIGPNLAQSKQRHRLT